MHTLSRLFLKFFSIYTSDLQQNKRFFANLPNEQMEILLRIGFAEINADNTTSAKQLIGM